MTRAYEAIIFDLDGTLVDLAVDWKAAAEPIKPIVERHGGDADADDALDLLPIAERVGAVDAIEPHLSAAECAGARRSDPLPAIHEVANAKVPVGVCSLNCEAACRIALETHGIAGAVDSIVGRDTVTERKPHPEPLLTAVKEVRSRPEKTLFVGDSDSDAETARRAGTEFRSV